MNPHWKQALAGLFLLLWMPLTASCQTTPTPPKKPHHTEDGFQNLTPTTFRGLDQVAKWYWQRLWDGIPDRKDSRPYFPLAENDPKFLAKNTSEPTLTWVGHATFLLQIGGVNILTDPHFSERASPFSWAGPKRLVPPGLTLEQLPKIDIVVISHNHYDHLDIATVKALAARPEKPRFFVPLGIKAFLTDLEIENVEELDWWDETAHRGIQLALVPAQHFSRRGAFDANETLWGGWMVLHPSFRFYHAGDTGYGDFFQEIQERYKPIDLSAIPIGAYEPRWFMKDVHLNPRDAVMAHQDLATHYSVGMHWGTFDLTDEMPETPPVALDIALQEKQIPKERFFVMQHGETKRLQPLLRKTSR